MNRVEKSHHSGGCVRSRLWRVKRKHGSQLGRDLIQAGAAVVLAQGGNDDGGEKWFRFWMCSEGRADRIPGSVCVWDVREGKESRMTPAESHLTHSLPSLPDLPISYF